MDPTSKENAKDSSGSDPSEANGAPIGEPNTLPLTFCRVCQVEVKPEGKGRCPRCQAFLRLNFSARKHPVNKLRREQLLDKFVRDYRPTTQRLQSMCEQYADVTEQLEGKKADGSTLYQRLLQSSLALGAALEASLPPPSPVEQVMVIRRVIVDPQGRESDLEKSSRGSAERDDRPPARPLALPAPEPTCAYGCGSLERCAELKQNALDAWQVLHYDDPPEVQRREAYSTAVMMKMLGKTSPYL